MLFSQSLLDEDTPIHLYIHVINIQSPRTSAGIFQRRADAPRCRKPSSKDHGTHQLSTSNLTRRVQLNETSRRVQKSCRPPMANVFGLRRENTSSTPDLPPPRALPAKSAMIPGKSTPSKKRNVSHQAAPARSAGLSSGESRA